MTSANLLQAPIAIIGMECRLPGGDGLDEYWQMLETGSSGIRELPPDRLDRSLYYDAAKGVRGKTYSTLGGLVSDRPIDRNVCPLTDEMVLNSDPCHQILCEVAVRACRQAGMAPGAMPKNSGVFIGHSAGSPLGGELIYSSLIAESADFLRDVAGIKSLPQDVQDSIIRDVVARCRSRRPRRNDTGGPSTDANVAAALIARVMQTDGPAMVVDAACASSMLGLSLGCMALLQGQVDVAIVGGASYAKGDSLVLFSAAQSCSATASRPFDARADGLISAEGYVALVLKTLDRAERDGDRILGVFRGIGVSSDGRGNSLWAPRREGQMAAVERAYDRDVDPRSVQYIEAHATSTQVGDAIEIEALASVFEPLLAGKQIPIGSVKSNIGHTLETAGLASVLKVLLALQRRRVPPTINLQDPNPSIVKHANVFSIANEASEWPLPEPGLPRRAAVNSFGIGGLNAHVVLEEYVAKPATVRGGRSMPAEASLEPIAVIGRGVVLPGAYSVPAFAQLLASGKDVRGDAPSDRWRNQIGLEPGCTPAAWRCPTSRGGYIRDYVYDWRQLMIPPKQISRANPLQFMLLDAAVQALRESGYSQRRFDKAGAAVVVGTTFGGEFANQLQVDLRLPEFRRDLTAALLERGMSEAQVHTIADEYQEWLLRNRPALLDETGSFTSSTLASRVAKELDVMGGALAIDADYCSSFAALDVAVNLLRSGACSMVFCAAAQRSMALPSFEILSLQGTLDVEGRGVMAAGQGFIPGEGAALVLLKRLSEAQRDGDPIQGIIQSVEAGMSPKLQTSVELAATRVTRNVKIAKENLAPIHEAGCGVPAQDTVEAAALTSVYGRAPESAGLPLIDQVGHTQAVHGLASLIKSTITHNTPAVPRPLTAITTHSLSGLSYHVLLEVPVQKPFDARSPAAGDSQEAPLRLRGPGARSTPPAAAPAPTPAAARPMTAAQSFAASVSAAEAARNLQAGAPKAGPALTPAPKVPAATAPQAPSAVPAAAAPAVTAPRSAAERVIRVGAKSQEELLELLRQAAAAAAQGRVPDRASFRPEETWRAAILATGTDDAVAKLQLAATHAFAPAMRAMLTDKGIFVNAAQREMPRIAVLFPGQGSSYAGMLTDFIASSHAAQELLREANALLGRLGLPAFEQMCAAPANPSGTDQATEVWTAQASMLIADLLVWTALREYGIRPDCVAGHSYGEIVALVAAGVMTLEQALRVTRARVDAIATQTEAGTALLSLEARTADAEKLIKGLGRELYITHCNAPQQTVVGGRRADLSELAKQAAAKEIAARELKVPRAFHSPLLAPAQWPFRRALAAEVFRPAALPLLSGVTGRYVADPEDIRQNLARQLCEPLHYVQLVERLADDGVTVFLEAGPQQVLTRLNRQVLAGRPALILASDQPQRGPTDPRLRLTAALETLGWHDDGAHREVARGLNGAAPATSKPVPGKHEVFDATQVRKEQARKKAAERSTLPKSVADRMTPVGETAPDAILRRANELYKNGDSHPATTPHPVDSNGHAETRLPAVPPTTTTAPKSRLGGASGEPLDTEALQQTVIDFIVDHTGYPAEIIDIDWDLEADLGIDSIKRAQLMGDLRELFDLDFDLEATDDISKLTELRTVRQILELIKDSGSGGKRQWLESGTRGDLPSAPRLPFETGSPAVTAAAVSADDQWPPTAWSDPELVAAPVAEMAYEPVATAATYVPQTIVPPTALDSIPGLDTMDSPAWSATAPEPRGGAAVVEPAEAKLSATATVAEPAAQPANKPVGDPAEWEKFLVDFVVEHTGYPREVIDMDADLEADLGIDSIQRAQLFGEMREHFNLGTGPITSIDSEQLAEYRNQLAEHRTLRKLMELLQKSIALQGGEGATTTPTAALEAPAVDEGWSAIPSSAEPEAHTQSSMSAAVSTSSAATESWRDSVTDPAHEAAYRRGVARGAAQADQLKAELRRMADDAGKSSVAPIDTPFPPAELAEFAGVADGAGVHLQSVLAWERRRRQSAAATPIARVAPVSPAPATVAAAGPGKLEAPPAGSITSRYFMRMEPVAPKRAVRPPAKFKGSALIVGESADTAALKAALLARGNVVHQFVPTDDPDAGVSYFEEVWKQGPVTHLFLLTPRDPQAATTYDAAHWQQRRARGILTPYRICQRWVQRVAEAKLMDDAGIVALTSLGGSFGFDREVVSTESGALTGLLKSILVECWVNGYRTLPIKLMDAPRDEAPALIVERLLGELDVPSSDMEIAWVNGERRVVRCIQQPPQLNPRGVVLPQGTWVCTGGARGITAYVANELAKRYGLTLCLLGTAPVPSISDEWRRLSATEPAAFKLKVMQEIRATGANPVEGWRNVEKAFEIEETLRKLAEQGIRAKYYSCDVGDRKQLAEALRQVRADFGPIRGVLHGAGYSKDARFDRKLPEKVDQCIRAKVDGALALMDATRNDALTHFIGFGSISGRFGANGHTDYSLSNDMLSKQIDWYRRQRPEVAAVTFHWHAWGDLGMAMKPESRLALEMVGIQFMPAREGLAHLLREIEAGVPESEVLITDDRYYRMYVPVEALVETEAAVHGGQGASPRPLIDEGTTTPTPGGQTTAIVLNPKTEPFLIEHRLEDRPLLPVVIALELFCEAAGKLVNRTGRLTLRNARAISGLRFFTDNPLTIQMQTEFSGQNAATCRLAADFRSRNGMLVEANRGYFEAKVEFNLGDARETRPLPQIPEEAWRTVQYAPRESRFYLGPNFQRLRKFALGEGRGWGKIVAPPLCDMAGPNRSVAGWVLPCAALDACLYATGLLAWASIRPGASLPVSFGELRFVKSPSPGEACTVETRFVRQEGPNAWFDFALMGSDGELILEAKDYRIAWLGVPSAATQPKPGERPSGTV